MRLLKLVFGTNFFELLLIEVILSLFDLWADVIVDSLNLIELVVTVVHRMFVIGV